MNISRDPAKSRPLSANVRRLMRLSRTSPQNSSIIKMERQFSQRDRVYCHKQGNIFMEAASMGLKMEDFAPRFMTSQLAGLFDVIFAAANGMENNELSGLLRIPMLLKSPEVIVEALYWIDDIVSKTDGSGNKSLAITRAYEAEQLGLPSALSVLPEEPNRNIEELEYAYWLGYIYRCECLMHEESSRMVYGAFNEAVMHKAYSELLGSPLADKDLKDSAVQICVGLDRLLTEKIWPENKREARRYKHI